MGILNVVFVLVILIAFGAVSMVMGRKRLEKLGASNRVFLEKHPDAARVYPYSRSSITSEAVRIHSVDGGLPELFYEAQKSTGIAALINSVIASVKGDATAAGVYLKPGTSTVELSYYHNRPGIMYKNVTTTTDVVQKDLTVEANKRYTLSFDRNTKTFTLEESA
jgi:hypothetical protein